MLKHTKNRRRLFAAGILFLMMLLCMPASAQAGWKQNSNGTYSYYKKGKLQRNRRVGEYYVNDKGVRHTGFLNKGGKRYFYKKDGTLLKSSWLRIRHGAKQDVYYAGPTGALLTDGKYKIGSKGKYYYYGFDKEGKQLRGKTVIDGKTYFFGLKLGQMQTKKWIKTGKKYYYYGKNGVMKTNQWVGKYYVNKKGARTNKVKDETENNNKPDDGGQNNTSKVPAPHCAVESTYYTHPVVDDTTLLSAIIYCESGNQPYKGQLAVGMVIMNRSKSSLFPSKTVREVVYAKTQFAPARDGSLGRALANPAIISEQSKRAAAEVIEMYKDYTPGKTMYLNTGKKLIPFPYLFFMTDEAYNRLGMTSNYKQIKDHVFFTVWKK